MEITKLHEALTLVERDPSHPRCGGVMRRDTNVSDGGIRDINPRDPSIGGRIFREPRIDGPLANDLFVAHKTSAQETVGGTDA